MAFMQGDRVTWVSQASGFSKQKTGEIVAVVPPGSLPDRERYRSLFRKAGRRTRSHESYVVLAEGRIYWPKVDWLRRVEPEDSR